jgi:hypothetical protein
MAVLDRLIRWIHRTKPHATARGRANGNGRQPAVGLRADRQGSRDPRDTARSQVVGADQPRVPAIGCKHLGSRWLGLRAELVVAPGARSDQIVVVRINRTVPAPMPLAAGLTPPGRPCRIPPKRKGRLYLLGRTRGDLFLGDRPFPWRPTALRS